jgi:hypothetical protein
MFAALVMPDIVRADDAATDKAFAALVQQGDRARFAGRNSDAVIAYRNALKIRNDPRIAGRLGMVALKGGATAKSMSYLLRAILEGNRIPQAERLEIESAFNRTLNLVTRVDIDVSLLGADVFIDGQPERLGTTAAEFYVFTLPGKHEVRATLAGHADAVAEIDAPKGGTIRVKLLLTPLNETEHDSTTRETITPNEPCPVCAAPEPVPSSPEPTPPASTKSNHTTSNKIPSWSLALGPTAVFGGVASFPALGVAVSVDKLLGSFYSIRLDLRYAMSPRDIEGYAIRGSTFGVIPSICVNKGIFSGCLLGQLGAVVHSGNLPTPFSLWRPTVGFGASASANVINANRFALRPSVDVAILTDSLPVNYGNSTTRQATLWTGYPFLLGVSIHGVWHASAL